MIRNDDRLRRPEPACFDSTPIRSSRPSWTEVRGAIHHALDEIGDGVKRLVGLEPPKTLPPGGVILPRERVAGDELRLFFIGDTGTGGAPQMQVAAALTAEAGVRKPHFLVHLGDVIYENGVESKQDPKLRERLLEPYDAAGKMYVMGGNHDHRGDIGALVAFTKDHESLLMPARYYGFGYDFGKKSADFFVLDTETLDKDPDQLAWLARAFRASTADYRIVLGHHPILSGGAHGDNDFMKSKVLPLIEGKAQLAAGGHDHDQQVLSTPGGTLVLVSGAGGKTRTTGSTDRTHFAGEGLGFSALTLDQKGLTLDVIDAATRKVRHREALALGERARKPTPDLAAGLPWAGAARSRFHDPSRGGGRAPRVAPTSRPRASPPSES